MRLSCINVKTFFRPASGSKKGLMPLSLNASTFTMPLAVPLLPHLVIAVATVLDADDARASLRTGVDALPTSGGITTATKFAVERTVEEQIVLDAQIADEVAVGASGNSGGDDNGGGFSIHH